MLARCSRKCAERCFGRKKGGLYFTAEFCAGKVCVTKMFANVVKDFGDGERTRTTTVKVCVRTVLASVLKVVSVGGGGGAVF